MSWNNAAYTDEVSRAIGQEQLCPKAIQKGENRTLLPTGGRTKRVVETVESRASN